MKTEIPILRDPKDCRTKLLSTLINQLQKGKNKRDRGKGAGCVKGISSLGLTTLFQLLPTANRDRGINSST